MEQSNSSKANSSLAIPVFAFIEHNNAPLFPVLDKLIQSTTFQPICLWFTLILYFHIYVAITIKCKNLHVQTYRVLDVLIASFPFKQV
jgi:hypothetical protein